MKAISLTMALRITEQKNAAGILQPFSITFFTADKKKDKGGNKIQLKNAVRRATPLTHRNAKLICVCDDEHPHPIHIHKFLITEINGKQIIL